MLSTAQTPRLLEDRLEKTAQEALSNVSEALQNAIEEKLRQDSALDELSTPRAYGASHIAGRAIAEVNNDVDHQAGGVGNAFGSRLFVQGYIHQRAHGVESAQSDMDRDETLASPLSPEEHPSKAPSTSTPSGEITPGTDPQKGGTDSRRATHPKTPGEHLAALLSAIFPQEREEPTTHTTGKSHSITNL